MNCMWYLYKSENWCKIITVFDGSRRLFRVFRKELLWDVMVEVLWQKPGNAFHFVFGWSSPSALSPYTLGDHFQYWMFWIRCVQSVVDEMETCQFSLNAFIYSIELSYCHSNVSGWISVSSWCALRDKDLASGPLSRIPNHSMGDPNICSVHPCLKDLVMSWSTFLSHSCPSIFGVHYI